MWWQHPMLDVGRAAGSTKPRSAARNWWNAKIQACFDIRSSLDSTTAGTVGDLELMPAMATCAATTQLIPPPNTHSQPWSTAFKLPHRSQQATAECYLRPATRCLPPRWPTERRGPKTIASCPTLLVAVEVRTSLIPPLTRVPPPCTPSPATSYAEADTS